MIRFAILLLIWMISQNFVFGQELLFSTVNSQRAFTDVDTISHINHRKIEHYIHSQGNRFLNIEEPIQINLVFHNHTSLTKSEFKSQSISQLSILNQAFEVDDKTHQQLTGLPHSASNRIYSIFKFQVANQIEEETRTWQGWDKQHNLNTKEEMHIYVYDDLPEELGKGYAHFPWISDNISKSIVLQRASLLKDNNDLVHIVGNYLGLYPLTGEYPCGDDYVSDTPIHNDPIVICSNLEITSTCDNQKFDTQNYMSHAKEGCRDHFTIGQWRRMLHIINFSKNNHQ